MKKSNFKLALRRETLRNLTRAELVLAAGGEDAQQMDTGGANTGCIARAPLSDIEGAGVGCPNASA